MCPNDVFRGLIKLLNKAPQTRTRFPDNEFPCESKEVDSYIKEHNIEVCRVDGNYVNDTILLGMEAYCAIPSAARIGIAIYRLRIFTSKHTSYVSYIATFYPCNYIRDSGNLEFMEVFKTESDPRFAVWYKDKFDYDSHMIEQSIRKRFPAVSSTKGGIFKLTVDCDIKIKYVVYEHAKLARLTVKFAKKTIKIDTPTYEEFVSTGVLDVEM